MKKYKIRCRSKKGVYYTETVEGEPIELMDGYEFFIREWEGGYVVTEVSTGYQVGGAQLRDDAIAKARYNVTEYRDFFINEVKKKIEENKVLFSELL
jgi:hypothetical protein